MFSRAELDRAVALVHAVFPGTPQYAWPLLAAETGLDLVVKHENHSPCGAFKVRGGIVYLERLARERPHVKGIVSATRGNHGQSLAFAAKRAGVHALIYVPVGNSREKNAAMRAFGAELVEVGRDFDDARMAAHQAAAERGYEFVPSYHVDLCAGVATYAYELLSAFDDLATVYVPIGLGSGITGLMRTRDLLGSKTEIVGVVSEGADAYARSFEEGRVVTTESADTFADGMATRIPVPEAVEAVRAGAARIVRVSDDEVAEAIRLYYRCTHNVAEGAGAAPLAAAIKEKTRSSGKRVGVVLCGGNIDAPAMAKVLAGETPRTAQG
jgi:threonine dehydratase